MTGQRRYARPQLDAEVELNAWRMTFKVGFDFLRALPQIGVELASNHQPDLDIAREAWCRIGDAFLAAQAPGPVEPWALRTFGPPGTAARPAKPRGRRR